MELLEDHCQVTTMGFGIEAFRMVVNESEST